MSYNNRRNNLGGGNKWQGSNNSFGGNLGSVNPWDSGSGLNAGASMLNSLVGGGSSPADAVQQLLAASKILTNVLGPQQSLLQTPQVPSLLGQANFGNLGNLANLNRGNNFDNRFNNRLGGRDNRGLNRRNDSGNYRNNNQNNNRGYQNNRDNRGGHFNKNNANTSSNSSLASQKKDLNKPKKAEEPVKDKKETSVAKKEAPKEENRYADIPRALLYCHVCRKYMWDDVSFDNHMKGRNHKAMLDELDKLYKMQCELMRQEFRMTEQQNGWYFDKAQRMGKKVKNFMDYCTMCDLSFHGTRGFHRKSTKHQELKHFLHPKCNVCNLEFPTRLEWDEHILQPAHLKKMTLKRMELKPDLSNDDFDFDDFLYVTDLSDYLASDLKPASSILTDVPMIVPDKEDNEKEDEEEKEDKDGEKEESEKDKKEKKEKFDENSVVFHPEDEDECETFIEEIRNLTEEDYAKKAFIKYNDSLPSGTEFVVQSAGHFCRICNLFTGVREEALKHCKSYSHHISLVNLLAKVNQARKTVRKRAFKDDKTEDVEMKETADGEEGNWKRRKVTKEDGKDKKMDVDDEEEEEEEEDENHVNGNKEEEEEKKEEEEEVVEVKEEPVAPVRSTPQRARRGRASVRK